jgi:hypothetical protein
LLASFILFVLNILSPDITKAQIFFSEKFDHDLSSWETHSTTGEWKIVEEELLGVAVSSSHPPQPSYALAGSSEWENYSLYVKIKGNDRPDKQIIFRVTDDGNYYVLNIVSAYDGRGNEIILAKKSTSDFITSNDTASLLHIQQYINNPEEWYNVKIDVKNIVSGVSIKIYINDIFIFEKIDNSSNPLLNGRIGFEVWPGGKSESSSPTINYFDDILVTEYDYEPALDLPVENLKQYGLGWGNETYDNAPKWAKTPTIESWGCALTSATMVLRYHGYDVWPNTLNDWLKNQPDGYIRNGLVNWLAIPRYTQKQTSTNSPVLKFRRYHANSIKLEEELLQGRPPILELPGHFIVTKGKAGSDFLINDPASEIDLLSILENTRGMYSSIISYVPTNTDLSYIMLVVDSDTQIYLFDSMGNLVNTSSYIQEPLQNNLDKSQTSGESYRILLFPEPKSDIYSVTIEGEDGPFQLDAYMYDQEGNLIGNKYTPIAGAITNKAPVRFQFTYDNNSIVYSLADHLSAQVTSVTTNKDYYKKGDPLEIQVKVTNDGNLTFDPTKEKLTIDIGGPSGLIYESFREQQGVDLVPGKSGTFTFYASPQNIPENWGEGNYTVHITIYSTRTDTLPHLPGGQNSNTQFTVDNIKPIITWNNPHDNFLLNSSVELNVNCDGTHGPCDYVNYWWFEAEGRADSSTKRYHQIWKDGNLFAWILNSLAPELASEDSGDKLEGNYILRAAAKDKAGNYNHSEIQVVFDNTSPEVPVNLGFNVPPGDYGEPRPITDVACSGYTNQNSISHHWSDESGSGAVLYQRQWQYPSGTTWHGAEEWTTPYTNYRSFGGEAGTEGLWKVRVRAKDEADNWSAWSSACTVIYDHTSPSSFFSSPLNDEIYGGPEEEPIFIEGYSTDEPANTVAATELFYRESEGEWQFLNIFTNTTNNESFNWNMEWIPKEDGTYDFKAVATDKAGNVEETAYAYGVLYDTTSPTLDWTSPAEEAIISGTTIISSNATDNLFGVESAAYLYQRVGESTWNPINGPLTNPPYGVSWDTTGLELGDYNLKAVATDNAGNSTEIKRSVGVAAVISSESWSRPDWGEITITWTTDRPTDGRVVYDTVSHSIDLSHPNYGYANTSGTVDTSPKTLSHTITLSGLTNSETYYWRTVSGGSPIVISTERRGDTFSIPGGDTGGEGVVAGVTTSATTPPFPYAEFEETSTPEEDSEEVLGEEAEIGTEEPETPLDEAVNILSRTTKGRILAISAFLLGLLLYFISRRRRK